MDNRPTLQAAAPLRAGVSSRRLMITLYALVVFLYWGALFLYVPTLPTYVQGKSDNLALVGVVLSMYGLWQMMIRLPLGIAADWLGWRKPFIFVGLALAGLAAATWVPLVKVFYNLSAWPDGTRTTQHARSAYCVLRIPHHDQFPRTL